MLQQISIDELEPGMYVTQVLRQSGKVRMRSSGLVKSTAVVEQLRAKGIELLEIDLSKSKQQPAPAPKKTVEQPKKRKPLSSRTLAEANALYQQAVTIQSGLITALSNDTTCDFKPVAALSQSILDSVFENQDALSCLTLIKDADDYLLEHSINCSILMGIFASHLEYDKKSIQLACLGALLMDIGMAKVPTDLRLNTNELSAEDWQVIRSHVNWGVEMVTQFANIPESVVTVIAQHHERIDGSGYPEGLKSETISEFARMAAIIDSYDAMVSSRPFQEAVTPTVALKRLTRQEGLDQTLVKRFIQCVGVHPVGSLVRLKSGKIGIISQLGKKDMLSPVVMSFYSATSGHYSEIKRLDLSQIDDEIVSGVRPSEFGINLPKFFREVFVHQVPQR